MIIMMNWIEVKIIKDLTGQRYGKLVALEIDEEETKKQKIYG